MTDIPLTIERISETANLDGNEHYEKGSTWKSAAFLCFAGSIILGIVGLLISGIGYFAADRFDSNVGTVLVFLAFPLMLFGAHALDKVSEAAKKKSN